MPKIKCKERDCKYNNKEYCIKEGIYVGQNTICESYKKGPLDKSYAFEFATFEDDEKGIKCEAEDCYHNKSQNCRAAHICVDCHKVNCETYHPK